MKFAVRLPWTRHDQDYCEYKGGDTKHCFQGRRLDPHGGGGGGGHGGGGGG